MPVSQPAYDTLIKAAKAGKFMWWDARNAKGLTRYIAAVFKQVDQHWIDKREEWMRTASIARLDPANDERRRRLKGRDVPPFPIWWDPEQTEARIYRWFPTPDLPLAEIRDVVIANGITDPRTHEFRFSDGSMLGAFLEAWGQEHIMPMREPENPMPPRYRWYPSKREIVW